MALPQNTVKLLEELESTSNLRHRRGIEAEVRVLIDYLRRGYQLVSHRKKYFNTEIDLVVESQNKLILIEVKYATHSDYLLHRMSYGQRRRLENVFLRFAQRSDKDVEFHYVIASQSEGLIIVDDFLSS